MNKPEPARRITVAEMAPHVHSFLPDENKVNKITEWLTKWIETALKEGKIKPNDYLPLKADLAFHICVSLGTMQNVYRALEDKGIIESRQRVGAYIKSQKSTTTEKLTSKREVAKECIKNYIKTNLKNNDKLLSARKLSEIMAIPFPTVLTAVNSLVSEGILYKSEKYFFVKSTDFDVNGLEQQTLVEKLAEHINNYIKNNLKPGDKIPSNNTLSDMFNVSVKTIHDAVKILVAAGILKTRRGCYGTIVADSKDENEYKYYYEQVEQGIKKYIIENCEVGDKLPSIKSFAEAFSVSTKTVKNALDNMADDGYINFERGRYGGTFVTELPVVYEQGYAWLALSPEFEQKN